MPELWRLYRAPHGPGLDGIGGMFASGRWHRQGERVVYFGASAAIVVLERLAHADPDLLPDDLRLGHFIFSKPVTPTDLTGPSALPRDWVRHDETTRGIGRDWLRESPSSLLIVPSAILPEESNCVFNPKHPDAQWLTLTSERAFTFDARLF
jgi:RES domain-containing protein